MNVIKVDGDISPLEEVLRQYKKNMTLEDIQQDYDFRMAQRISKKIYEAGLLTEDEYHRLQKLNRERFPHMFSALDPDD